MSGPTCGTDAGHSYLSPTLGPYYTGRLTKPLGRARTYLNLHLGYELIAPILYLESKVSETAELRVLR